MLEDFNLSFDPQKMSLKIETEGVIGVIALYKKIREWEASEAGIVFPEVLEGIDRTMLPGGEQTAVVIVFINGWRLASDVRVQLVGGLIAGKDKEGKACHPVVEASRSNIQLASKDRDFIPTEAQIQHMESEAAAVGKDWEVDPSSRMIRRRDNASDRVHSIFGLYWFLKKERLQSHDLSAYSLPIAGDNRAPVEGLERRWDLDGSWSISPADLDFLVGGPLVHRGQLLVPPISDDKRKSTKNEAGAAARSEAVTIGIMTALPEEFAAVRAQMDDTSEHEGGRGQLYVLGKIPARNDGQHQLALTMTDMGNNMAAARATAFLHDFPSIGEIIMVGIAGAVPNPTKADEHVRLGDIVVSGPQGVVQYDYEKDKGDVKEPRHLPRPPSPRFQQVVSLMQADLLTGTAPWNDYLSRCSAVSGTERPPPGSDLLARTDVRTKFHTHPDDPNRANKSEPLLFVGTIGAANKLLKDPVRRDQLRDQYQVKAVEMESSGIADSTFVFDAEYFVIRGTSDYCDGNKNDEWQGYAAAIASAFLAALLRRMPLLTPRTQFPTDGDVAF